MPAHPAGPSMAPPPMAPPTLTSATTTPRQARNPWRRQRPQRTPTPPIPPPPDGDYPQTKNSSTTNNQYTTRGTPPSPTPPRHLSHLHHRRRRGPHHPSLKKVPTRTGPRCAPSACYPCRLAPDQRLHLSKSRVQNPKIYKIKSSFNPEQQPDPTNTAITQSTIQYTLRASVQHTGRPTVAGMYKNCIKEESPEIGI